MFYLNELGDFAKAAELLGEAVSIKPRRFALRMTYVEVLNLAEKYEDLQSELDRIEDMTNWQDAHIYSDERIEALRESIAARADEVGDAVSSQPANNPG